MTTEQTINIEEIIQQLPHRYPFLLIDKIIKLKKNESVIGIKNVSINEPFFTGHFPGKPIMPGVLIIESMAQTSAILVIKSLEINNSNQNKVVYFMSIDKVKFRKPVIPGDQLHLNVQFIQNRGNVWKFRAKGEVDNQVVAEANFSAMILDK
jgi:3-hydroxyacyl-[acyl-carrier-protein] dehydratase